MSNNSKKSSKLVPVAVVIIVICVVLILVTKVLPGIERSGEETTTASTTTDSQTDDSDSDIITYNGQTYEYNRHLTNILVMGIDKSETTEVEVGSATGGQSDLLYLISIDRMTGSYKQIKIPRDTITKIEYYDEDGNSLGWFDDHISLQFAYGDGKSESCRLSKSAVSKLFYGIPILNYCAVNMDVIQPLAELAGEVTVTVPNDSLAYKNPEYVTGAQVVLTADNTEEFVRSRNLDESQSAIGRSERQTAYLEGYKATAKAKLDENVDFLVDIYDTVAPYMTTNLDMTDFIDILTSAVNNESQSLTIPGEGVQGEQYDEYIVGDDMQQFVIDNFYELKE